MEKFNNLNPSSLIDLKAELQKKYESFNKAKTLQNVEPPSKRLCLKNKKPLLRQEKTSVLKADEENEEELALQKSRKILEAKAKLYEQITSKDSLIDDESNELYLVDFQRKVLYENKEPETRKCNDNHDSLIINKPTNSLDKPEINSKQISDEKDSFGPIHYQDVQFNEIRDHGTGYFAFSTDEAKRKEQMEELNSLRQETEEGRQLKLKHLKKKQALLQARLAKICERRNIDQKVIETYIPKEVVNEVKPEEIDISTIPLPNKEQQEVQENKEVKIVRPWDMGKKIEFPNKQELKSHNEWAEERRNERNDEFAPPTFY